jgi:aldehyde:ferredoxin oxidoreductase
MGSFAQSGGRDIMVISGQAKTPVYIWINQGHAEIRKADHLYPKVSDTSAMRF